MEKRIEPLLPKGSNAGEGEMNCKEMFKWE